MQLLLKDKPILDIQENGTCRILDFDRLPFALRKENITFIDFIEWASNRTLSIGRSYAKEILNSLRLSQTNRFAVCKACRGLSLEDAYWIRQEGDDKTWKEVNLFHKLTGFCPLFDHDHAFVSYKDVMSQTAETQLTLRDAAVRAQKELKLNLDKLDVMERPQFLSAEQWDAVLVRKEQLS